MKGRIKTIVVIMSVLTLLLIIGCSGGGSDSSLVNLSPTITPTYQGATASNVDIVQSLCTQGTDSGKNEFMGDHGATATFVASLVSPKVIPNVTVTIDRYTIDYVAMPDSPNAPPIQRVAANNTMVFTVPSSGGVFTESTSFFDVVRKEKYVSDMNSGLYSATGFSSGVNMNYGFNNYNANYLFYGSDSYGNKLTIGASHNFEIGNFIYCAP